MCLSVSGKRGSREAFPLTSLQLMKFGETLFDAVRPPAAPDYSNDD